LKIARILINGKTQYGICEKDIVLGYHGIPFPEEGEAFLPDGSEYKLNEVKMLAPCLPSKIVCLGLNYQSHIIETKMSKPENPLLFLKPSTAIINPEDYIIRPKRTTKIQVDYEGEVGVVIGRTAKDVTEDRALEYILGYTCFNDVSERYAQKHDGQWTRSKGYDTFAPLGPCIETEGVHDNINLETYVNGELRQSFNTNDLIFNIPKLIEHISHIMTLLPGDIIATGTASGIVIILTAMSKDLISDQHSILKQDYSSAY